MKYRILGKTGMNVSEIGFGAWALGGQWGEQNDNDSIAALHKAIDLGVNFIDTAAGYGDGRSEQVIAKVLKERKEEIIVATKAPPTVGHWPPSPYCKSEERYPEKYLRESVEERLRFLGVDCLDILQLHTWTRAWNSNPVPFEILADLKKEGKIRFIGVSTPEHDQDSVIDLIKKGYVDVVQLIYNIFEQEPASELLPMAKEYGAGTIIRVVFDEGSLTGKFIKQTKFDDDDFRSSFFEGDRLQRTIDRVEKIRTDISNFNLSLPHVALKFALQHEAVSTVIPGIRSIRQAEMNAAVSDAADLDASLMNILSKHFWRRGIWYGGK